MHKMGPLVDLMALSAYRGVYILGRTFRTHRLARLCCLVGEVEPTAFVDTPEACAFDSALAPCLTLEAFAAMPLAHDIAILCDGSLSGETKDKLQNVPATFFEARFSLNLFFPEVYDDHLLDDMSFLRLWDLMFRRRGLAASVRAQQDLPYMVKINYDAVARPHYAYVMSRAAQEAKLLGLKEISVMEFGVAGGNGLANIEEHAEELEKAIGVKFRIYGFDSGKGLPRSMDLRDQPYFFQGGDYPMDEAALRARLKRSQLVIGLLSDTVKDFWNDDSIPPVGAVMFDLDYYSSTMEALALLANPKARRMPRVTCYFDDITWYQHVYECVGELMAIRDFNLQNTNLKMVQALNLDHIRVQPAPWNQQIFVLHDFEHPDYTKLLRDTSETGRLDLVG